MKKRLSSSPLSVLLLLPCAGQRVQSCVLTTGALLSMGINWYVKKGQQRTFIRKKKEPRGRDVIRAAIFFLNPLLEPLRVKEDDLKRQYRQTTEHKTTYNHIYSMCQIAPKTLHFVLA